MRIIRFIVTWGGESLYVSASSPLDAVKQAAEVFRVRWQTVVSEMDVTPLYEVKGGIRQW